MRCDVTEWDDQQAAVAAALEQFGRLDAFFANAGFGASRGFLEESPEHWRAMVDTNVYGAALSIRASLGHFKEQDAGHFLVTGSAAGRVKLPGSLYSATKWAVHAMADGLRQEVSDTKIKSTVIAPGWSTRRSSTTQGGRAGGRRRGPGRAVRALAARPRGRERGAGPAELSRSLEACRSA